jgi:hypothetical protein
VLPPEDSKLQFVDKDASCVGEDLFTKLPSPVPNTQLPCLPQLQIVPSVLIAEAILLPAPAEHQFVEDDIS